MKTLNTGMCISVIDCNEYDAVCCRLFGLIAKKQGSATENACHIFAELDPSQPASAIVNFITKVMMGQGRIMKM